MNNDDDDPLNILTTDLVRSSEFVHEVNEMKIENDDICKENSKSINFDNKSLEIQIESMIEKFKNEEGFWVCKVCQKTFRKSNNIMVSSINPPFFFVFFKDWSNLYTHK